MDLFDIAVAKKLAGGGGGGGGSSNVVTGTFTPTATGTLDVPLAYTGTGYPIKVLLSVKGGFNNPDNDFYSLISQQAACVHYVEKIMTENAPDYETTSLENVNRSSFINLRKNSSSSAQSYDAQSTKNNSGFVVYGNRASLSSSTSAIMKIASNTLLQVYVSDAGSYGFRVGTEYEYVVVYSS